MSQNGIKFNRTPSPTIGGPAANSPNAGGGGLTRPRSGSISISPSSNGQQNGNAALPTATPPTRKINTHMNINTANLIEKGKREIEELPDYDGILQTVGLLIDTVNIQRNDQIILTNRLKDKEGSESAFKKFQANFVGCTVEELDQSAFYRKFNELQDNHRQSEEKHLAIEKKLTESKDLNSQLNTQIVTLTEELNNESITQQQINNLQAQLDRKQQELSENKRSNDATIQELQNVKQTKDKLKQRLADVMYQKEQRESAAKQFNAKFKDMQGKAVTAVSLAKSGNQSTATSVVLPARFFQYPQTGGNFPSPGLQSEEKYSANSEPNSTQHSPSGTSTTSDPDQNDSANSTPFRPQGPPAASSVSTISTQGDGSNDASNLISLDKDKIEDKTSQEYTNLSRLHFYFLQRFKDNYEERFDNDDFLNGTLIDRNNSDNLLIKDSGALLEFLIQLHERCGGFNDDTGIDLVNGELTVEDEEDEDGTIPKIPIDEHNHDELINTLLKIDANENTKFFKPKPRNTKGGK